MAHNINPSPSSFATISKLAERRRMESYGPIAKRYLYSLRLIAVHERGACDPVPELAARLGGLDIAAKALGMAQTISAVWPENIHVSRFCCECVTHDEATIGELIDAAELRDQPKFESVIKGLIRPDRVHRLWEGACDLIAAEYRRA